MEMEISLCTLYGLVVIVYKDEDIVSASRENLEMFLCELHELTTHVKITNAPVYYANNVFKFITAGKFNEEDDGFDGFKVKCEFLKSRTNKAGKSTHLIYNQSVGFDPILTQLEVARDHELLEGRAPYNYFKGYPDIKFSHKRFREKFFEDEKIQYALMAATIPKLQKQLSTGIKEQEQTDSSNFNVMLSVLDAYNEDAKSFEEMAESN